jgi:GNAT superfamily N-acetyltransferase
VSGVAVRAADAQDAAALVPLLGQLGYPTDAAKVRARLQRLFGREDAGVRVAQLDGELVGVAGYQLVDLLERTAPQCRLTTLVVREGYRRRGIARVLIDAVEQRARRHGCFRLEVTTQPQRTAALALYEAVGFECRPHRLVKQLLA